MRGVVQVLVGLVIESDAPRKPDEQGLCLILALSDREDVTWRYRDDQKENKAGKNTWPLKLEIQIEILGFPRLICPIREVPFGIFSASLDAELIPNPKPGPYLHISQSLTRLSPVISRKGAQ